MKTIKELEAEKDFIILRSSNYHYDLGTQHEKERVLGLNFDEIIKKVNQETLEEVGHITFAQLCFEELKKRIIE